MMNTLCKNLSQTVSFFAFIGLCALVGSAKSANATEIDIYEGRVESVPASDFSFYPQPFCILSSDCVSPPRWLHFDGADNNNFDANQARNIFGDLSAGKTITYNLKFSPPGHPEEFDTFFFRYDPEASLPFTASFSSDPYDYDPTGDTETYKMPGLNALYPGQGLDPVINGKTLTDGNTIVFVSPPEVSEPLTILGSTTALVFGTLLKKRYSKAKNLV